MISSQPGSNAKAREAGKLRLERRKDYEVRDGDVILFRFNVWVVEAALSAAHQIGAYTAKRLKRPQCIKSEPQRAAADDFFFPL